MNSLHKQFSLLWRFLGFFQKPFLRALHAVIVVLVFFQLLGGFSVSPLMSSEIFSSELPFWGHILTGLTILLLALTLAAYSLYTKGFRTFFPYMFGDIGQLRTDFAAILRFNLPAPRAGGLASSVQGLGLGALLLTALTGGLWFVLPLGGAAQSCLLQLHSLAALLLALYFAGHGGMGLQHFVAWQCKMRAPKK